MEVGIQGRATVLRYFDEKYCAQNLTDIGQVFCIEVRNLTDIGQVLKPTSVRHQGEQ